MNEMRAHGWGYRGHAAQSSEKPTLKSPEGDGTPRSYLLGVPVSVVSIGPLLDAIDNAVTLRNPTVFVGLYASLFRIIGRDPQYRAMVARSVTYPDGQGVVAELRKRRVADAERLATTDIVHPILKLAAGRNWRVGLYGSAAGVAERAASNLRYTTPGLNVVAVWDGYSPEVSVAEVQDARVDLLFVALGARRQETWAYDTAMAAGVPAIMTCGGLLDFLAGDKRRAPRWLQQAGLEWAFRVMLEPRRLIGRYLLGNSYFLWCARIDRAAWARVVTVEDRP